MQQAQQPMNTTNTRQKVCKHVSRAYARVRGAPRQRFDARGRCQTKRTHALTHRASTARTPRRCTECAQPHAMNDTRTLELGARLPRSRGLPRQPNGEWPPAAAAWEQCRTAASGLPARLPATSDIKLPRPNLYLRMLCVVRRAQGRLVVAGVCRVRHSAQHRHTAQPHCRRAAAAAWDTDEERRGTS